MQYSKERAVIVLAAILVLLAAAGASAGPNEVLILESTVKSPASSSREYYWVQQLGFTPVVVNSATWGAMSTAQFSNYEAVILGDPLCQTGATAIQAAIQNQATWNAAVGGNVILIGTDVAYHYQSGGDSLIKYGIAFATAGAGTGQTGAFISLSCYYNATQFPTQITMLDSLSSQGTFSVYSSQCNNVAHMVVTHPALTNLTDSVLSNWGCSTHEVFDTWPTDFQVLAIGSNWGTYQAIDGSVGQPYILVRGEGLTTTNCINAPPNLLDWWKLDETSGPTAADIRGLPNNGAHVGSPTPVAGRVQGALQFDGINDEVDVADAAEVNFGTGDFSIDVWINTLSTAGIEALVDKIDTLSHTGYALILNDGQLGLEMGDGTLSTYSSGTFVADGSWHLVAATVERNSVQGITFYVDGFPVATANPTPHGSSLTNTNQLVFGARSANGADRYTGSLDEIEMFGRALTDVEMLTLRMADSTGKCPQDIIAGACCIPNYGCVLALGAQECASLGGFYLGDSTFCDTSTCPENAPGACCLPNGNCVDSVTEQTCVQTYGGIFQGTLTTCATSQCRPQGACCVPAGLLAESDTCVMVMGQAECDAYGGFYYGDFTSCDSVPCDTCDCLATGDLNGDGESLSAIDREILYGLIYGGIAPLDSMCHADLNGDCVIDQADLDLLDCYLTNGMSCFTPYGGYPVHTCCDPSTVTGACCMGDSCYQYAAQNCIEGSYQGDSVQCMADLCLPDTLVVVDTIEIGSPIIVVISVPPIIVDTAGPIVVGPFEPGPTGVIFEPRNSAATLFRAGWQALEPGGATLPTGAFLMVKGYQIGTDGSDQSVGTAWIDKRPSGLWRLQADFSSLGATSQTVEVYSNGQLIATLQQHTGPAATADRAPDGWHVSSSDSLSPNGFTGTWNSPAEVDLTLSAREAMHVSSDSIRIIPENPTTPYGYLKRVVIGASDIPSIGFTDWSVYHASCCLLRGDADASGTLNVADLTYLVAHLFQGGPPPPCPDEGDTDNSGSINVSDLTFLVAHLFQGGPPPPPC